MLRPGGPVAKRPLHFMWIADCSGSMEGAKIETLNLAIRDAIPHMQDVARDNPHADIFIRAIRFSNGATWHIVDPTPVNDFRWTDLVAAGTTDMGKALSMVADQMKITTIGERALPPVLVLLSDGQPTDDFGVGLRKLMDSDWGKRAVRIAIAIGADADKDTLQRFVGHKEIPVLEARNAAQLTRFIRWASTVPLQATSSPASSAAAADPSSDADPTGTAHTALVPTILPAPPPSPDPSSDDEVW